MAHLCFFSVTGHAPLWKLFAPVSFSIGGRCYQRCSPIMQTSALNPINKPDPANQGENTIPAGCAGIKVCRKVSSPGAGLETTFPSALLEHWLASSTLTPIIYCHPNNAIHAGFEPASTDMGGGKANRDAKDSSLLA